MGLLDTWSSSLRRRASEPESLGLWAFAQADAEGHLAAQGVRMEPMSWEAICRHADFKGRWVALDHCRYDESTGRATEGAVVDVDDDLVELCNRIRESEHENCAILFCGADGGQEPPSADEDDEDPFRHSAH